MEHTGQPGNAVVMANGLTRSGFIDWFAGTMVRTWKDSHQTQR